SSCLAERSLPRWVPFGFTPRPATAALRLRTRPPKCRVSWDLTEWSLLRRVRISQSVPFLRGSPQGLLNDPPPRCCFFERDPRGAGGPGFSPGGPSDGGFVSRRAFLPSVGPHGGFLHGDHVELRPRPPLQAELHYLPRGAIVGIREHDRPLGVHR